MLCHLVFVIAVSAAPKLINAASFHYSTEDSYFEKFPACKENSPSLNRCIQESLNRMIPTLAKGLPGQMGLDPLALEPATSAQYSDDNMSICLNTTSVIIKGLSSAKIHAVKSKNLYMGKLELVMKIPKITAIGNYSTEGIISTFPISSSGPFNLTMNDVTVVWIIWLERYSTGRESKRLGINNLSLDAAPEQIHIEPAPVMDGERALGNTLEVYLNQNSYELYNMIKTPLMNWLSQLAKDLVNLYMAQVPASRILS